MGWYIYFGIVLVASLLLGWHLGRFREACTEMTGMMAGMTIGMLGGFALGYGMAAAAGRDLFVGNLVGVILGAVLGGWFGRAGGLMGTMDGAMGGVMGGSMGAMIAAMIFPDWKLQWTGVLFGGVSVVGALALTALIESRTPDHGHLHVLLPRLTGARRATSQAAPAGRQASATRALKAAPTAAVATRKGVSTATVPVREAAPVARPIRDYYALLKVEKRAGLEAIEEAYLDLLATADDETVERADRALTTLRDPARRARYDAALEESRKRQTREDTRPISAAAATALSDSPAASERGDCCPPPKKKKATSPEGEEATVVASPTGTAVKSPAAPAVQAAATAAPGAPGKAGQLPPKNKSFVATNARQTTNAHSSKDTVVAASAAAPNKGPNGHGYSNANKQQQGNQGKQNAQQGKQQGSARQSKGHGGQQKQARNRGYAEPASSTLRRVMTGSVVGAAAMLLVFWIAFGAAGSASGAQGAQTTQDSYANPAGVVYHAPGPVPRAEQLEGQAVVATIGADGVQTADLVLDEATSSYNPIAIKVRKGVPVRLNISSTGAGQDCRSVVDITALGARGFIEGGRPSTMNFTPTQLGVYEFNCPMRMVDPSYLVVTD